MAHLALELLGPFAATLGGSALTFRYEKLRALLAYLAVEHSRAHPRPALVGLLWPETPEADARRNLSQALFNLRQLLGEGSTVPAPAVPFLLITREAVQFNAASPHTLDVAEFERLVRPASPTAAPDPDRLEQAGALYRGDFLQHVYVPDSTAFEEWALLKREALRRQALQAMGQLAAVFEQQGRLAEAGASVRRQLALEPWREEAHRDLMRLLALSGERSAALAQYEICRQALAAELGVEPAPATRALFESLRAGGDVAAPPALAPAPAPAAAGVTLPAPATPFVGRADELTHIAALLADPKCRLLTLVGPGGVGKTRLALQAAAAARPAYADRVYFVPLAPVAAPEQLVQAIAHAVGLPLVGGAAPETQLFNFLRERPALVVLDNFEHLSAAAPLLVELLAQAPPVKLLVTARAMLAVHGEWTFDIAGLPVTADEIERGGALALFEQTARRVRAGFTLGPADRAAAALVCQLLGGLPLGIEIAASWTRVLTCAEIAQEIQHDLDFLTTASRDVPERHRSLRGVLDQAWRMLAADEQQLLAQLGVFQGGFQREAAQHVAGATLQQLSGLIAKSLLRPQEAKRYDLHELVRRYAADRLADDPAALAAAQARHAHYYAAWLAARAEPVRSAQQTQVAAEIRAETANWHAAWQWAVAQRHWPALRQMIPPLGWYYEVRGYFGEAVAIFEPAVAALRAAGAPANLTTPADRAAFAFLVDQSGWFLFRTGQIERAVQHFAESLALAPDDPEVVYYAHANWGFLALLVGDLPQAQQMTAASLDDGRALESAWHMAIPLSVLGMVAHLRGEVATAYDQLRASLDLWHTVGDPRGLVFCLNALAGAALDLGQPAEATAALHESLALTAASGDRWAEAIALDLLGQVEATQGRWAEARAHFQRSVDLHAAVGNQLSVAQGQVRLAEAVAGLGDRPGAQHLLGQAYSAARRAAWGPTALEALAALAALQAADQPAAALAAALGLLSQAEAPPRVRARAQQVQTGLAPALAPAQQQAAAERAATLPLDALAADLLAPAA